MLGEEAAFKQILDMLTGLEDGGIAVKEERQSEDGAERGEEHAHGSDVEDAEEDALDEEQLPSTLFFGVRGQQVTTRQSGRVALAYIFTQLPDSHTHIWAEECGDLRVVWSEWHALFCGMHAFNSLSASHLCHIESTTHYPPNKHPAEGSLVPAASPF